MPIPAAVRRALSLLQLPPAPSVRSRVRGHGETGWPIRSHGQACNLQYVSSRNVHHQSHIGTRTQLVDSKHATPTTFDPCPPAGVPTTHFRDYRDLYGGSWNQQHNLYRPISNIIAGGNAWLCNSPPDMISHGLDRGKERMKRRSTPGRPGCHWIYICIYCHSITMQGVTNKLYLHWVHLINNWVKIMLNREPSR
jgi:hypothetical protein